MSKFAKSPHTLDSFWMERMKEVMANPFISKEYRKRCEKIYMEALARFSKVGIASNHYPHERR